MWNTVRGENARIRPVGGLVGPCSGRPGIRVAGVSAWMSLAIYYVMICVELTVRLWRVHSV